MGFLRIAVIFAAIAIASGVVAYLFTRDRSYLRLSGRIAKVTLFIVLIILGLMFLERLIHL